MGIYIKNMNMPENCDNCIFSDWSNLHQTACCKICEYDPCFNDFSKEYLVKRAKFCPLVKGENLINMDEAIEYCNTYIELYKKIGFKPDKIKIEVLYAILAEINRIKQKQQNIEIEDNIKG